MLIINQVHVVGSQNILRRKHVAHATPSRFILILDEQAFKCRHVFFAVRGQALAIDLLKLIRVRIVHGKWIAKLLAHMAQVTAGDQQCASAKFSKRGSNRGHKLLACGSSVVISHKWHQRIWDQRGKQGNIAVEILNPRNVHLHRVLAKMVDLIRVNTL